MPVKPSASVARTVKLKVPVTEGVPLMVPLAHLLLQATPRLREALCAKQLCDAAGVPVELPRAADFRAR